MTRILIVDDEMSFVTYLKALIDWPACGYQIVGVASNGSRALEFLQKTPVDIVLTDMRMPVMDGAELIQRCQHLRGKAAFIALSSFQDFEYVHKSLRFGAVDYLLKYSLTAQSLLAVLEEARKRVHGGQTPEDASLHAQYRADRAMQVLSSTLHAGHEDEAQVSGALEEFGISLGNSLMMLVYIQHYAAVLARLKTEKQQQRCLRAIQDMCQNVLDDVGRGVVVKDEANGRFMLLCSLEGSGSYLHMRVLAQQIVNRISNTLRRMLNLSCTVVVSGPISAGANLQSYIERLETIAQLRFYKGGGHVLYEQEEQALRDIDPPPLPEEKIRGLLQRYDLEGLLREVQEAFAQWESLRAARHLPEAYCMEFSHCVMAQLKANGVASIGEVPLFLQVRRMETAGEMRQALEAFCTEAVQRLEEMDFPEEYSEVTKKALRCIATGYAGELSLESIARQIDINSAYLSRMFKKDVRKGFVEYLNSYRIRMACRMIVRNIPLKEVAQSCGFASYNYFFKVFREQKGMTPQEYRKHHENLG